MIESVMSEQKCSTSGCRDDYDQHQLPESTSAGTEASYRAVFDETSTKSSIIRSDSIAHRYSLVEAGSLIAPDLVVGEPVLVNPCSYAAMHVVLKRILQDSGIGLSRSWVVVGCNGLPYNLASRVICHTFNCPLCDRRDISEFKGHVLREYNQTIPDAADHRTYGSILLVPGPGHMEINMTKATFKLLWHIILQDLAKLLGFRSAKAQASCQNASDHHKAWQMTEVLFWRTGAELIVPYVRECQRPGIRPDVAGFGEWLSNRTDKNFVFLADVIFTYVMALILFRCGIRRGNHSLALQSFSRFSDLFFGLNMTQYQELSLRYHHTLRSCPDDIHTFLKDNLSYSASGADDRGEGGDFILEAKNRRIQMWMPPGLPTPHHWQRICRNLDTLDSIRDHLTATTSGSHHVDLSRETRHWRHHLRQSAYLGTTMSTRPHVSLGAKALDLHLSSFAKTCQDNKTKYVEETTDGKPLGCHHQLQRVFVLASERKEASDVTKKTNIQLCGHIVDTIARIHDAGADQLADSLRREYMKDVRTGTKAVLLTFLQRAGDTLTEVLEQEETQGRAEDAPGQ